MNENKKVNTTKLKKILIPIAVILVLLLSLVLIIKTNGITILMKVAYSAMPESYVAETQDGTIEYFIEYNKEFKPDDELNNLQDAYNFYYYDENGSRVDVEGNDTFTDNNGTAVPIIACFSQDLFSELENARKVFSVVIKVVIVVLIIGLIVLWFFKWSKKQDMEKEKKYGNNKQNKSKKKK